MNRICKKCGGSVKMEDTFCMHCGMSLEKEEPKRDDFIQAEPVMRPYEEKKETYNEEQEKILSVWDYLLMLIILAIPVVNIIACIIWIVGSDNRNRKNFAKAWMIITVVGTILSGILAFGLFQFIVMDHPVNIHEHIEYSTPEEQFIDDFLTELDEV